jgi:ferritin-like metal-binding protein YciE
MTNDASFEGAISPGAAHSTSRDENSAVNSAFLDGLRNAHAMELEAAQLLQRQIERSGDFPELQERLKSHLAETRRHEERLDKIFRSKGQSSSSFKDATMSIMGNLAAAAHMPASDEILKNAFASVAFENFEAAAYTSLITLAELEGASEAAGLLRQTLAEEQAMADWLARRIDGVTRRYIELAGRAAA